MKQDDNEKKENLEKKIVSGMMLTLLLASMLTLALNIQPVKAEGTIYIRADGSIDPPTAPIQRNGDIYTMTGNISSDAYGIVIERNNMTLEGAGYSVQGTGSKTGIYLSRRSNVTIKSTNIGNFAYGIYIGSTSNNSEVEGNKVSNNTNGLYIKGYNNTINENNIVSNRVSGIFLLGSRNTICGNNITSNGKYGIVLDGPSNTIDSNAITANTGCGISVRDGALGSAISRNQIIDNSRDGMYLYNCSDNRVEVNNITGNSGDGIYLGGSSNNSILNNNISDNGGQRIRSYLSTNVISPADISPADIPSEPSEKTLTLSITKEYLIAAAIIIVIVVIVIFFPERKNKKTTSD